MRTALKGGCWVCGKKEKENDTTNGPLSLVAVFIFSEVPLIRFIPPGLLSALQYIINDWFTFTAFTLTAGKGNFFESIDGTYDTLAVHLPSALMEKSRHDDGEDCAACGI